MKSVFGWLKQHRDILLARAFLLGVALVYLAVFPGDTPGGNSLDERVLARAKDNLFNYVEWEVDAISQKFTQQYAGEAAYLTEAQRSEFVVNYLKLVRQLQSAEAKLNQSYCDPNPKGAVDPALVAERDRLQKAVDAKVNLAEAIIDEQVSSQLRDEGLATLGAVLPPVAAHITELPQLLVVSPRSAIKFQSAVTLTNMGVDKQEALEAKIDHDLNVSSQVVPIGGLSLYPSMVEQTWYSPFVFEVAAHEWTHHYLFFFPLGLNYMADGETRTINETTASIMGKEISRKVIKRFYSNYPDIMAQLPPEETAPAAKPAPNTQPEPPKFDFGKTMNDTRVQVDKLLADGKIAAAEQYMERQRQVFNANGYCIRKLNQAYFAFYGGYQSPSDNGAGGTDPIGPAIAEIRNDSPSVKTWLETMRSITTRDQLLTVRDSLGNSGARPEKSGNNPNQNLPTPDSGAEF